jgi:hypothetical protein
LNKCGNPRAYGLDRLDRDRPDLAQKVREKMLSANAAASQQFTLAHPASAS